MRPDMHNPMLGAFERVSANTGIEIRLVAACVPLDDLPSIALVGTGRLAKPAFRQLGDFRTDRTPTDPALLIDAHSFSPIRLGAAGKTAPKCYPHRLLTH